MSAGEGKKSALVPKLRFPEFRDDPEWTDATLEELITTISPPAKLPSSNYRQFGKFPIVDQSKQAICGWTDDASAVIEDAWPLIVFGDHTCALKLISQPFAQGADGIKIFKAKTGLSTEYLFHSLNHRPLEMEDYKRHFSILKERRVFRPGLEMGEQQKIADCLSSLDELIAAQGRKVEALKIYKRGLMQQLFPREGETLPRLRFPEFRDAPAWEEQSVEDFGRVVTGSTPSTAQPAFYGGGLPFVSPADISDLRFVDETKTTLTADGFAETRHIRAESTLFVCIGSTIGKVAQNIRNCATNQQINAVVPSPKHSDGFVYFALSFASERIALLAGKQAVPIIKKSLFSSVRLLAPKLAEQQRIADCLSRLDTLIAAATQELETLRTHKKGLIQQLFPSLGES